AGPAGEAPAGPGGEAPAGPAGEAPAGAGEPAKPTDGAGAEATQAAGMDGQTYAVRLRDLQQRIDQLKEQIRRSHTRLSLLSDTILSGGGSGSRTTITFENKLSDQFKLTRLLVVLDGSVQYIKTDRTGGLGEQGNIPI